MRGDEPAFPHFSTEPTFGDPNIFSVGGLTKRELMATMILAGMWANTEMVAASFEGETTSGTPESRKECLARHATEQADALLAELERGEEEGK